MGVLLLVLVHVRYGIGVLAVFLFSFCWCDCGCGCIFWCVDVWMCGYVYNSQGEGENVAVLPFSCKWFCERVEAMSLTLQREKNVFFYPLPPF